MKTEWHSVFLGRLINILSAKAYRSAKQDELRSCSKTEQETELLGVSRACKCDSYWPHFGNQTPICWIFPFFSFVLLVVFFLPVILFFFNANSARLHWFWKRCKQIRRACFCRGLPAWLGTHWDPCPGAPPHPQAWGWQWVLREDVFHVSIKKKRNKSEILVFWAWPSILKFHPRSCSLCRGCLKVSSVFFLGLRRRMSGLQKGSRLTSSRVMGTKAVLPRASYSWAKSMQLIPGKAPVCCTKCCCQIRFLFKKQRGHQKQWCSLLEWGK